jgi:23S rRNA (cytosine1962-C5)-methyltransferase
MEKIGATLRLKNKRDKPIRNRHPWVFSGAVDRVSGQPRPGDLVAILNSRDQFLAQAYYNPHSQIQARILTWDPDELIDEAFWQTRLERAMERRRVLDLEPLTNAYRVVHAEADGLPGLIVDKYDTYLVIQCLTLGIDRRKEMLRDLLAKVAKPAGIVERSDVQVRRKENLKQVSGPCWGEVPPARLMIRENGLSFGVDLLKGHKTGAYLDQRQNRLMVCQPNFVAGKELLNLFAYTGGFAVYAAVQGAAAIANVDTSAEVLTQAEYNVRLNVPEERSNDEYIAGDAFEVLRYYRDSGRQFDVVILDPPKFAHSQRDLTKASRGYKDLNLLAMKLLRPGGLLATFSCSGRVSADLFQKIVFSAALDAGRDAQIIQFLGQAADHPILLTFPESSYLKGLLCHVW